MYNLQSSFLSLKKIEKEVLIWNISFLSFWLLLGGAGLLIGALSGSKSEKKKVSKISIKVVVSDIDKPGHNVVFYDDAINVKQPHETDLRSSAARADEWTQRFQVIIGTDNAP